MTKDEMKNKISLALKDPILQQGFEIICKENTELEKENGKLEGKLADLQSEYYELENFKNNEIKELEEKCSSLQELVTYYQTTFCQEG